MKCDQFIDRWQALLDARQPAENDAALCGHASECAECAELLATQTVLFRELPIWSRCVHESAAAVENPVSRPLASTVRPAPFRFSPLPEQQSQAARSPMPKTWIAIAVAASLLLLLIPVARHELQVWDSAQQTARVARLPDVPRPSAPVDPAPVESTGEELHVEMTAAEQEALQRLLNDMTASLSDGEKQEMESLRWITGGFQPLANTLGDAWEALRNTLPVQSAEEVRDPQARFLRSLWRAIPLDFAKV